MPWNLLLLPLLGGFVFLDWCLYTRLRAQRIEGNRLLLEGAFAGALLTAITYLALVILALTPLVPWIQSNVWSRVAPKNVDYLGTAVLAFCVGPAAALLINWVVKRNETRLYGVKVFAIASVGESVLGLLHEAAYRGRLVEITTTSHSAYTAYVFAVPDLRPDSYAVLLPVLVGFADKESLQIRYIEKRFWRDDPSVAQIIIPLKSIETARFTKLV